MLKNSITLPVVIYVTALKLGGKTGKLLPDCLCSSQMYILICDGKSSLCMSTLFFVLRS